MKATLAVVAVYAVLLYLVACAAHIVVFRQQARWCVWCTGKELKRALRAYKLGVRTGARLRSKEASQWPNVKS